MPFLCSMKTMLPRLRALVLWPALAWLAACTSMSDKPKDGFLVEGTIENPQKGKVVALYKVTPEQSVLVDSVALEEDGKFRFVGKVDQLQMFMLMLYGQQPAFFVAGNQDVEIEVKGAVPQATVKVEAGEEQQKLEPVLALFRRQSEEFGPINYEYQLAVQNRDIPRAERYRGMLERGQAFYVRRYKHLIDSLGPSFGAYTAATRLNLETEIGVLDTLAQKLTAKYPQEPWVKSFAAQIADAKQLGAGAAAPGFEQPTPDGKMLGPAAFKGKVLVLDFWASWCRPCRMNSPAMVALYNKYQAKGVEFLGISLDQGRDKWLKAVEDDGYRWPQVSDLKEWDNAAARLYKVDGIPHLVLIDREGKLLAKGLQPQELDAKLAALTATP